MDIRDFRNYYDSYYDPLCHFLHFYTQDITVKEDVLQDVFVQLWEHREEIEIKYVKTYLFHAARNRVLNYLRSEDNRHQILEKWFERQKYDIQGRDCFDIDDFMSTINKIVDMLPPRCREIFQLSHDEKLTYQQIADKMNISVKTVEAQMGIALKKIREAISISPFALLFWLMN
jgi:RNA polymerase sigma-70 factor (family 1)